MYVQLNITQWVISNQYIDYSLLIFHVSLLSAAHSSLIIFHIFLFIISWFTLLTLHFSMFTPTCLLLTPGSLLLTSYYSLFIPLIPDQWGQYFSYHSLQFASPFSLLTPHFSFLTTHFPLFAAHSSRYISQCFIFPTDIFPTLTFYTTYFSQVLLFTGYSSLDFFRFLHFTTHSSLRTAYFTVLTLACSILSNHCSPILFLGMLNTSIIWPVVIDKSTKFDSFFYKCINVLLET